MKNVPSRMPLLTALSLCVALLNTAAHAADAPVPSPRLEKFFKQEQFGTAVLSPNRQYLAVTTAVNGRLHLAVIDLETRKATPLAGFTDSDICSIDWTGNDRLIFQLSDRESRNSAACWDGMFAINRDGSGMTEIVSTYRKQEDHIDMAYRQGGGGALSVSSYQLLDNYRDDSNNVIVIRREYGRINKAGLYKLNTTTGNKKEIFYDLPGTAENFLTDNKQQLRLVVTRHEGEKGLSVWYRDNESSPWRKLADLNPMDPEFDFAGFDEDNKTMYVTSRNGGDRMGVYKFDFATNKPGEKVVDDAAVDVTGPLVFGGKTHKLLGIRVRGEPPHTHWLNKDFAAAQEIVDGVYPDRVNVLSGDPESRILVYSYSATHPGEYSLYDPVKKKLEYLFASRPWIKQDQMADKLIFDYTARDGLQIPAYLTIPRDKKMKSLPLVVFVHGGPSTRDYWNFDPAVQFLADLGYVVLQPEYRGSTGYGWKHFTKGWKQWGLAMQDDIADGVENLAKQGVIDPKRVCIMGASYGGYATMMGLIKNPDLYRCGIDLLGVTDINLMYTHGRWHDDDQARYGMKTLIGDPDDPAMAAQFKATSPALNADKIKSPVFMVYNGKDTRVPLIHGEHMRDALKAKGKPFEWMEFDEEEHGFTQEANRYKLFGAIEKFLKTYNPAD